MTYSGAAYNHAQLYTPPHGVIDVVGKEEEDSETYSGELSPVEDYPNKGKLESDVFATSIKQEKDELLNNNDHSVEIST